jgi:hypothetical protein
MKENKYKGYIGPVVAAIAFFVVCMFANGGLFGENKAENILYGLCNCFTLPGVILSGVGAISWAGKFGTFDMMAYGSRSFFGIFIKPLANDLPPTFYEYKKQKDEKGRKRSVEVLITGLICLAIGGILTILSLIIY